MFPVTLEFHDNTVVTVLPPCYGFLKKGNWSGGYYSSDDDDDDDDYYDTTYEVEDGSWVINYRRYGAGPFERNISNESRSLKEVCMASRYSLDNLKYIWNSGTHLPLFGICHDGSVYTQSAKERNGEIFKEGEFVPEPDFVSSWAEENGIEGDWNVPKVMSLFEEYLDRDSESCIVWHSDGFMGVKADFPADRCLFYLMLNRFLNYGDEKSSINTMMKEIVVNGLTPMQALLLARTIVENKHFLTQSEEPQWYGNDYDNCLLPISLITVGQGKRFSSAIQVNWRQSPYPDSEGHLRDEDYPSIFYSDLSNLRVSNSMFLPLLHPELCDAGNDQNEIKGQIPLSVEFVNRISLNTQTKNQILHYGSAQGAPNMHRIMSILMHERPDAENSQYRVVPRSEWVGIVKDLLLS